MSPTASITYPRTREQTALSACLWCLSCSAVSSQGRALQMPCEHQESSVDCSLCHAALCTVQMLAETEQCT